MNENATGSIGCGISEKRGSGFPVAQPPRKLYETSAQIEPAIWQYRSIVGYRSYRFDIQVSCYDSSREPVVEDSPINRIMGRKSRSEGDPVHKAAKATVLVYCPSSGWHEVLSSINKDYVAPDQIDALTVDLLELAMSVMS